MMYRITDPRSPRYCPPRRSRSVRPDCQHEGCTTIMHPGAPALCYKHRKEAANGN